MVIRLIRATWRQTRRVLEFATGAGVQAPPPPGPADPQDLVQPRRNVIVTASDTPNPAAMKFSVNVSVVPGEGLRVDSAQNAAGSPLAERLMAIEGVRSLYAVGSFVSVTKAPEASWGELVPPIKLAIREALA